MVAFVEAVSTNRKNNGLSFASFRQILTRITKSFLLKASSASIQFAATELMHVPTAAHLRYCSLF
jgi:hypothetical protein